MATLIALTLYILSLFPVHGEKDTLYVIASAQAIASVTDDPQEQLTLARIQRFESGFGPYGRMVARCQKLGDGGKSKGAWQVQPMSSADDADACGPLAVQAALALRYVHRSAEMCPGNEGAARLNLYVSGRCGYRGPEAAHRWGVVPGPDSYFAPVPTLDLGTAANDHDAEPELAATGTSDQ